MVRKIKIYTLILIEKTPVEFLIDASAINVLNEKEFEGINKALKKPLQVKQQRQMLHMATIHQTFPWKETLNLQRRKIYCLLFALQETVKTKLKKSEKDSMD